MSSQNFKRWLYRGGRPNLLARMINRFWASLHTLGISPDRMVTLEVKGRNLHGADGYAVLRHGRTEAVRLLEVPVEQCAPILKAYLRIAPGARPHIPVDKDAPLEAFAAVAAQIPVFRVVAAQ